MAHQTSREPAPLNSRRDCHRTRISPGGEFRVNGLAPNGGPSATWTGAKLQIDGASGNFIAEMAGQAGVRGYIRVGDLPLAMLADVNTTPELLQECASYRAGHMISIFKIACRCNAGTQLAL